jgi:hypothetical protein
MIDTTNATFHQRPESLNTVRVDFATNILFVMVSDSKVTESVPSHMVIGRELIGVENGVPINFVDCERNKSMTFDIRDYLSNYIAVSLSSTNYDSLALCPTTTFARFLTTYIGLIDLNLTSEMLEVLSKKCTNLLEHSPRRLISDTCLTLNLFSRDTASGRGHAIDNLKPCPQGSSRLVEYGVSGRIDLMTTAIALIAWATSNLMMLRYLVTYRAMNPVGVAVIQNPFKASLISRELGIKVFCSVFVHFSIPLIHVIITQGVHVVKG